MNFNQPANQTREQVIERYKAQRGVDLTTMRPVSFKIDGVKYETDIVDTYYCNLPVRLPNGRVFQFNGWLESLPPSPCDIEEITDNLYVDTTTATKAWIAA